MEGGGKAEARCRDEMTARRLSGAGTSTPPTPRHPHIGAMLLPVCYLLVFDLPYPPWLTETDWKYLLICRGFAWPHSHCVYVAVVVCRERETTEGERRGRMYLRSLRQEVWDDSSPHHVHRHLLRSLILPWFNLEPLKLSLAACTTPLDFASRPLEALLTTLHFRKRISCRSLPEQSN